MPDNEPNAGIKPPVADAPAPAPPPAPAPAPAPAATAPAPAAPQLDPARLQAMMDESFKKGLEDFARNAQPVTQPQPDPIAAVVGPIVAPALEQVGVRSESAMDAAMFYSDADPSMAAFKAKHKGEIEELFNLELKARRFTPRDAILSYLRGGKLFKETVDAEVASRKEAEDRANAALTAGPGSPRGQASTTPKDPWKMTPEDLDKELEGIPF